MKYAARYLHLRKGLKQTLIKGTSIKPWMTVYFYVLCKVLVIIDDVQKDIALENDRKLRED